MSNPDGVLAPLVVFDCRDDHYWPDPQVVAWCRSQGIDPSETYRLEVYLVDCPSARVYEFDADEKGDLYFTEDGEVAKRPPYDVILSSLPPETPATEEETTNADR